MPGGYECLHVPLKGGATLVKNPWVLGGGAFFVLVMVNMVGIWPFVIIGAVMLFGLMFIIYLQIKANAHVPAQIRTVRMEADILPWCIGNHGVRATTIFRVITNEGMKEIPVCDAHIGQTESWLARQQLTRG